MDIIAFGCSLGAMICWGVSPVLYRFCGRDLPPERMQASRSLSFFATALLLCLIQRAPLWPGWIPVLVLLGSSALVLGLGDSLYFQCVSRVGAGKAAALCYTFPVFSVVESWLLMDEGLSWGGMAGVFTVVLGLILLCCFKDECSGLGDRPIKEGFVIGILSGLCWSTGSVSIRWAMLHTSLHPAAAVFWRALALLVFAWCGYLKLRRKSPAPMPAIPLTSLPEWLMFLSGAFVLTLPNWLIAIALQRASASVVTPVSGGSPALAAVLGCWFFGERITAPQWLGVFCIIGGGIIVSLLK